MPCTEADFQQMPLDFVKDAHAIMFNNGSLYPIKGKFVDDSVCPVVPKGSTWARNPVPRIHTGKCKEPRILLLLLLLLLLFLLLLLL